MKKVMLLIFLLIAMIAPTAGAADVWNMEDVSVKYLRASGTSATYTSLSSGYTTTDGGGSAAAGYIIGFQSAAHGLTAGSMVEIAGTANYTGVYSLTAVTTNSFSITTRTSFVAELMDGTETVSVSLRPNASPNSDGDAFQLLGFRLTLDAAASTVEPFTVTVDSNAGSSYDNDIYIKTSMSGVKTITYTWPIGESNFFVAGDAVDFEWINTDGRTWAIEVLYRKLK